MTEPRTATGRRLLRWAEGNHLHGWGAEARQDILDLEAEAANLDPPYCSQDCSQDSEQVHARLSDRTLPKPKGLWPQ